MKKADIKVGFLCNNYCLHCVQGDKRARFGNKGLEHIKDELIMARKNCTDVVFTGGEPTIHKDFLKLVVFAKALGFKQIQLQTNARMFAYKDFAREAVLSGINNFCIAVLGHKSYLHDSLTGVKGSFRQLVKGVENLKALGADISDNTVITKKNYKYLAHIARYLVTLGVRQYQFAFIHPLGNAKVNFQSIVPRFKEVMPYVRKGLDIGIKSKVTVMTEAIPYCFMKKYEDYIAERIIPETEVFDADFYIGNYSESRKANGKAKGPACKRCYYDNLCEGPWKEYPEYFGWSEFKPVRRQKNGKKAG
ncbi:MAG: radical SAM protein [Candidatus Omnitrophota bacterium]|jgi:MoaA/NifB/PqqE/SkfB family radical SAM enzyme|nr:MAG: radical SAM protein [Candidatus Omnitrophota bacterium]